ncbi:MAG: hypothetical protein JJD96_07880 [Thermoleophilia bacterium]|nr:hypothetical protein [Thermoleophilia bacterium]
MKLARVCLCLSILSGVMMTAVVAGCGESASITTAPSLSVSYPTTQVTQTEKRIDPCSLITKGEAEAVLGNPAIEPKSTSRSCTYHSSVDELQQFSVTVEQGGRGTYDTETKQNQACGANPQPVPSLGNYACSANNTVMFLKKDLVIVIMGVGTFDQNSFIGLGEKAANRIP